MTHEKQRMPLSLLGQTIINSPRLAFKVGVGYLRFKGKAAKAGKLFHDHLIHQGIDETTAQLLTEQYLAGSNIKRYFNSF